jgi:hypothetical protein
VTFHDDEKAYQNFMTFYAKTEVRFDITKSKKKVGYFIMEQHALKNVNGR